MALLRLLLFLALGCTGLGARRRPTTHHITLEPQQNLQMRWTVDYRDEEVAIEVGASLSPTQWLGLGFSERGELAGADLCVLWVDWKRRVRLQHGWVDGQGRLTADPDTVCRSAQLLTRRPEATVFRFRRRFNTCRPRDYVLDTGTTHIVWVSGPGPLLRLENLQLSHFAVGMARVQLLRAEVQPPAPPPDAARLELRSRRVAVPDQETTYWCTVHRLPAALARKHHIIQYEAVVDAGNEDLVHHMEVFHCEAPVAQRIPRYEGPCHAPDRPPAVDQCKRVLAAWAMGADPLVYPEEAGLPIGGPDFNPYVMLEVHYNNPNLKRGHRDSSGVRLTYTERLRPHDASVMELGLEYTDKMAIPPGMASFELSGYCVPECTAVGLLQAGIRVFASQLHTHLTGVAVRTEHVRADGTQLPDLNRDEHYSTHYQEIRLLPQHRAVMPGDALITTCRYQTLERPNVTLGGFSITDEMCVNYIHYFPKVNLEVCKSSVDSDTLRNYFRFMNRWEGQPTENEQNKSDESPEEHIPDWGDKYKSIRWNKIRSLGLQQLYATAPLSMQCNQSNGDRFAGYWERVPLPTVRLPLLEDEPCPARPADLGQSDSTAERLLEEGRHRKRAAPEEDHSAHGCCHHGHEG
ncbi:dopamine beta-hydroxylase-like isoform X1 [Amphibalanus amphitrite]|uniref:dopamine beta-hydroxylase-like isoform X1 n=1 Tax=Amphibalanus amphitrite TaxID=1232801 RepID=UPI001C9219FF|nr:dopamine beta-hydroxylase-like isoform X1 [Amphibalanus amphitrite]